MSDLAFNATGLRPPQTREPLSKRRSPVCPYSRTPFVGVFETQRNTRRESIPVSSWPPIVGLCQPAFTARRDFASSVGFERGSSSTLEASNVENRSP